MIWQSRRASWIVRKGVKDASKAKYTKVDAGGTIFHIVTFQAQTPPEPKADGAKVLVGGQTIALQDGKILFGKFGAK